MKLPSIALVMLIILGAGLVSAQVPQEGPTGGGGAPFEFCSEGEQGTGLEITEINVDNNNGEDHEWILLNSIEIEVEVQNTHTFDEIEDVVIEMGFFNNGQNYAEELYFLGDDENIIEVGDLDDGEEETVRFYFRVPADFEVGDYALFFKAYPQGDQDELCTQERYDETINVNYQEDEEYSVVLNDIELHPEVAERNEIVEIEFEVYNIGDMNYDNQILITATNEDLNLHEEEIILGDFDSGDDESSYIVFLVPQTTEDGEYPIALRVYYDYDYIDETYDEVSAETWYANLIVKGGNPPEPSLEERIEELERRVKELENRTTLLERLVKRIIDFLKI